MFGMLDWVRESREGSERQTHDRNNKMKSFAEVRRGSSEYASPRAARFPVSNWCATSEHISGPSRPLPAAAANHYLSYTSDTIPRREVLSKFLESSFGKNERCEIDNTTFRSC